MRHISAQNDSIVFRLIYACMGLSVRFIADIHIEKNVYVCLCLCVYHSQTI